jgi:hypothetical protein
MLLQCPCGGIVRCNGLFDGRTTNPRNFSDQTDPISRQRRDSTTSATSAITIVHRKPASPGLRALPVASATIVVTILHVDDKPPRNLAPASSDRRTLCRSAASPPHEQGVDVTPVFSAAGSSAATACWAATNAVKTRGHGHATLPPKVLPLVHQHGTACGLRRNHKIRRSMNRGMAARDRRRKLHGSSFSSGECVVRIAGTACEICERAYRTLGLLLSASAQRLAVQLQARRRVGASILHDIPAAGLSAATAC